MNGGGGGGCEEDERGNAIGEGWMWETREAEVVSNGVMKGGGQSRGGSHCVAVRQMY